MKEIYKVFEIVKLDLPLDFDEPGEIMVSTPIFEDFVTYEEAERRLKGEIRKHPLAYKGNQFEIKKVFEVG